VHDGTHLLMDVGNGSLANLQRVLDVSALDALVVSHAHPDHFVDVYGLYYALRFHPDGDQHLPVYAPRGFLELAGLLLPEESRVSLADVLGVEDVAAGDRVALGSLELSFGAASHPIEALTTRVEAGGRTVVYTGDTAYSPAVVAAASGADLLVCDATWLDRQGPHPEGVHSTGLDAGRMAAEAGVARLMVTHVYPRIDPDDVAAEARSAFVGEVLVANDLDVVEV
jgi:ribonuclease BN (tRNA processing enzyme)